MNVNTRNTIFQAAGILGIFALLSRIVGLYRDRLFAANFGAGDVLDSYYAAFRVPDLVFNLLILGTLSVAFIPIFTEYFIKDRERAQRIGNTVLIVAALLMSTLCLVLYAFVPEVTRLAAPGFEGEKFENTVMLTRIFLLSPVIFTLSTVFASILQSLKRFVLVSIAPIMYNFGIIAGIVWLYPKYGLKGLAYGVILGAVVHLIIQMSGALYAGFRLKPAVDLQDEAVKKIGKLFLWRIIGIDSGQLSLLIASIIGSTLMSGTIAVFNLANNLQSVVIGMFGISFATAAFPTLSEHFARQDHSEFSRVLNRTAVHILFFVIPVSVLFILLRAQIVRVILGTGNFDWDATRLTANALGVFALSLFAQGLAPLFSRAFYAMHNTHIPVIIGTTCMLINAGLSALFGARYGVVGLSLAFSIASIVNAGALFFALRPKLQNFDEKNLIRTALKVLLATLFLAVVTYISLNIFARLFEVNTLISVFAQGATAGILGLAAFIATASWLGLDEVKIALGVVKRAIFR